MPIKWRAKPMYLIELVGGSLCGKCVIAIHPYFAFSTPGREIYDLRAGQTEPEIIGVVDGMPYYKLWYNDRRSREQLREGKHD
jgi:hypothetical protein